MKKTFGGVLVPYTDIDAEKMTKFKHDCVYEIDIKTSHNPVFRGKVFTFFDFCFKYWCNKNKYLTANANREFFRKEIIKLAGYTNDYYNLSGFVLVEAKSMKFEKMNPEEFEECYSACIQVVMNTIFKDCTAEDKFYYKGQEVSVYEKLMSFF